MTVGPAAPQHAAGQALNSGNPDTCMGRSLGSSYQRLCIRSDHSIFCMRASAAPASDTRSAGVHAWWHAHCATGLSVGHSMTNLWWSWSAAGRGARCPSQHSRSADASLTVRSYIHGCMALRQMLQPIGAQQCNRGEPHMDGARRPADGLIHALTVLGQHQLLLLGQDEGALCKDSLLHPTPRPSRLPAAGWWCEHSLTVYNMIVIDMRSTRNKRPSDTPG